MVLFYYDILTIVCKCGKRLQRKYFEAHTFSKNCAAFGLQFNFTDREKRMKELITLSASRQSAKLSFMYVFFLLPII